MMHTGRPAPRSAQAEEYMHLALLEAERAAQSGEVPIGAVIVQDGKLLAAGQNRTRRDGVVHAHAELIALALAERHTGDFRLVVKIVHPFLGRRIIDTDAKFLADCIAVIVINLNGEIEITRLGRRSCNLSRAG